MSAFTALSQTHKISLTGRTAHGHGSAHLAQELRGGLQDTQSCSDAACHSDHTQGVTQACRGLSGQTAKSTNTAQARAQVYHLSKVKKEEISEMITRSYKQLDGRQYAFLQFAK